MNKTNNIEDYITTIYNKCEKTMPNKLALANTSDDNTIPTIKNYNCLITNNYNVPKLKMFVKNYKLKISGNKNQLINRLYVYLKLSAVIVQIQKIFRGRLVRRYNYYHGPALLKRELCTNDRDFLTDDSIKDLIHTQFFSYKDEDNFIYGFDIISLHNLILKSGINVKNPYNRNIIPTSVITNMRHLIRLSRLLHIKVEVNIKDESDSITPQQNMELRVLDLFQNINGLGNYSDSTWFMSLTRSSLVRFLRELIDIWNFRAQLSGEVKRQICPPHGEPFRLVNFNCISCETNIDKIRITCLNVLEKLVNTGIDRDCKSLGAYYVLGALTLVNPNAASALPWLFQSVSYI